MKNQLRVFIVMVSVSILYGESNNNNTPVYSGPITLGKTSAKVSAQIEENPFVFKATLDGSKKYSSYSIILKDNWKSFSVDLETNLPQTTIKEPFLVLALTDSQIKLYQHVYFKNRQKDGQTVLMTSDPDVPRDGKLRPITHENKTILGKHRIRFQQTDKNIIVSINGDELFTYEKTAHFDYVKFGAKGYLTKISNLKINGNNY
ncbi:MAG: hypothetical protein ACSHX0_02615 [Akkermansiaceae bacterium]